MFAVMLASRFERLSFDPFSLLENGFVPAKVDVGEWPVSLLYGGAKVWAYAASFMLRVRATRNCHFC